MIEAGVVIILTTLYCGLIFGGAFLLCLEDWNKGKIQIKILGVAMLLIFFLTLPLTERFYNSIVSFYTNFMVGK